MVLSSARSRHCLLSRASRIRRSATLDASRRCPRTTIRALQGSAFLGPNCTQSPDPSRLSPYQLPFPATYTADAPRSSIAARPIKTSTPASPTSTVSPARSWAAFSPRPFGTQASTSELPRILVGSRRAFSTTSRTMAATKIDGTGIAKKIRERLHAEISEKQKTNPRFQPSLTIIQGTYCASPCCALFCTSSILTDFLFYSRRPPRFQ